MGYITKCNSGTIFIPTNPQDESIIMKYIQYYDAKNNKSKFIITGIYVALDKHNCPYFVFDGKIRINGEIVYTASKSKRDAIARCYDNEYIDYTQDNGITKQMYPFRAGLVNSDVTNDDNNSVAKISPIIEVEHDDELGGRVKIEFLGNSSSKFYFYPYDTYEPYREPMYTRSINKDLFYLEVTQDNGLRYYVTYRTLSDELPQESFLFKDGFPDNSFVNGIQLSGTTIQQINSSSDTIAGERCNISVATKAKHYYKMNLSLGEWEQSYEFTEDSATFENGIPISYCGVIPLEALNYMPNSLREKATAVLWTYLDAEYTNPVGDSEPSYFYVSVPSDVIPTITSSSAVVTFTNSDYNLGEAISGHSYVVLSANAEGIYGSSIKKFIISGIYNEELDGSWLDYTGKVIDTTGIKEFSIIAVDSRGMRSEQKQYFINFYQYEKPNIVLFDAYRASGIDTDILIRPAWEITSVNNKNSSTGTVKFKKKNEIAWRTLCEVQNNPSDPIQVFNPDEENGDWDKYTSYEFMLVVQDATKNYSEQIKLISTIKVILDFKNPETREGYGGVGIGKTCELENFAEIWLNAKFYNDVYIGDNTLSEYIFNTICKHIGRITVSKSDFQEYSPILSYDYPYRASILIDGVTADMEPSVTFCFADSVGGNLAPSAVTFDGGINIYAAWVPDNDVVIDSVTFWKGNKEK